MSRRRTATSLLLLAPLLLVACGGEPPAAEPTLRPVRTETVTLRDAGRVRTFSGVARADLESRLSFRVPGTLVALPVEVGDRVDRGRVIARLDPVDYELGVEEAEAALAQARSAQRNADASYDRARDLYENNNASKADLDAARAAAESAAAQVDAAEKRLQRARQQLSYTVLTAPAAGAIAAVDVAVNENLRSGQPVVLLTGGDRLQVEVAVPAAVISVVEPGMATMVAFDALPGRRFAATVSEVGVASVGTATTYPVTVTLEDGASGAGTAIRPGMAAEVSFRFGDGDGRVLVPPVAVVEDRQGRFAFVAEPTDEPGVAVVRRRPVTVGELSGAGLEVRSGLEAGELVITAGARTLEDGMRVRTPATDTTDGGEG